jgi:chromosome segregation ATPase
MLESLKRKVNDLQLSKESLEHQLRDLDGVKNALLFDKSELQTMIYNLEEQLKERQETTATAAKSSDGWDEDIEDVFSAQKEDLSWLLDLLAALPDGILEIEKIPSEYRDTISLCFERIKKLKLSLDTFDSELLQAQSNFENELQGTYFNV